LVSSCSLYLKTFFTAIKITLIQHRFFRAFFAKVANLRIAKKIQLFEKIVVFIERVNSPFRPATRIFNKWP